MITYNSKNVTYTINAGTAEEKSVKAMSAKQAAVAFCKGGMSRGCYVTYQGKDVCDNADAAVSWNRYSQLLNGLVQAEQN
jgi:hypothetical protein